MAIIVQASFTVDSNTLLTSYTPDTGTGFTEEVNTGGGNGLVLAATDNLQYDTNISSSVAAYSAQPDPGVNEYDIEFSLNAVFSGSGTRTILLFGRFTDADNSGYVLQIANGATGVGLKLYKESGGSATLLDELADDPAQAGDKYKLEIRNAAKKVYRDRSGSGWVEVLSSTDDTITVTGKAGLAWGALVQNFHIRTEWRVDDFVVTEVSAAPATGFMTTNRGYWS